MKKIRLSEKLTSALNDQMTAEAYASQVYLSFAAWADNKGYEGVANFLFRHAQEERNHMTKILEYILKRGAKVKIDAIAAPPSHPANMSDCFEKVFEHEIANTKGIYKLVKMSFEEEDWATWNFMQWFVKEQTEEETMAMDLLSKIKIAGGEKASDDALFVLDREIKNTPGDATLAQDVTADNP
jgi:ferritin